MIYVHGNCLQLPYILQNQFVLPQGLQVISSILGFLNNTKLILKQCYKIYKLVGIETGFLRQAKQYEVRVLLLSRRLPKCSNVDYLLHLCPNNKHSDISKCEKSTTLM